MVTKKKKDPQLSPQNRADVSRDISERGGVEPALKEQLTGTSEEGLVRGIPTIAPKFEQQIITPSTEQTKPQPVGDRFGEMLGTEQRVAERETGRQELETAFAENPARVIGESVGALAVGAAAGWVGSALAIQLASGTTAVNTAAQVGGEIIRSGTKRGVVQGFVTNPKTTALTASWLGKTLTNPAVLMSAIGSYPFAGFIKEEALQTLSFATKVALDNDDLEGAERATAEVDEILNAAPSIIDKIPYANIVSNLKKFFDAAALKNENDKRAIENKRNNPEEERLPSAWDQRAADIKFSRDKQNL